MTTLVVQLITKMGLIDELYLLEKSTELIRLLELRSSNVPLQINEYGKIVLCVDISCSLLDIDFDKEQALKLSGLRKTHYVNNKRMLEKLLELNKIPNVNEICIQLGLNEVARKAEELLTLFKDVNGDISDTDHPQYAAMAVFQACRLLKQKVSKPKIMPFSNLRPTQWQQLEHQWERMIEKHHKAVKVLSKSFDLTEMQQHTQKTPEVDPKCTLPEVEDYEKWKSRMISLAEAKQVDDDDDDDEDDTEDDDDDEDSSSS